jgi:hypothetical protein
MPILQANRVHFPEDTTEVSARFEPCPSMEERSGVVIRSYRQRAAVPVPGFLRVCDMKVADSRIPRRIAGIQA